MLVLKDHLPKVYQNIFKQEYTRSFIHPNPSMKLLCGREPHVSTTAPTAS
jgi:hypothetical protein